MKKVNINKRMAAISEYWQPETVGRLNGQLVKLVKLKGEFMMHHHEHEDEMFMVHKGSLDIVFEDKTITLSESEFLVIPRGIPHKPVAAQEVEVLLFEPESTVNTGNITNELTRQP
ncbi:MAG: cupin domain-containing protein [Desulfobulbus sp.]|nr:MAG: cupin domain-containing protein [Desulfobulbus sp.]